jgi:hypothetical protein
VSKGEPSRYSPWIPIEPETIKSWTTSAIEFEPSESLLVKVEQAEKKLRNAHGANKELTFAYRVDTRLGKSTHVPN